VLGDDVNQRQTVGKLLQSGLRRSQHATAVEVRAAGDVRREVYEICDRNGRDSLVFSRSFPVFPRLARLLDRIDKILAGDA